MKKREQKSKKFNIALTLIVGTIVIAVLISIGFTYIQSMRTALFNEKVDFATELVEKTSIIVTARCSDTFSSMMSTSATLTHSTEWSNYEIRDYIDSEKERNDYIDLEVITLDGRGTLYKTTKNVNFSETDYFKAAKEGERFVTGEIKSEIDGLHKVVFSVPVFDANKNIAAVLVASQDSTKMKKLLNLDSFNGKGYSYIITADGTLVLDSLNNNSLVGFTNIFDEIAVVGTPEKVVEALRQDIVTKERGNKKTVKNGEERLFNYHKTGIGDWYIVTIVPLPAISQMSDQVVKSVVIAVVLFSAAITILIFSFLYYSNRKKKIFQEIAYEDYVTKRGNWRKFLADGGDFLKENSNDKIAMIVSDIDRFKVVNDIFGHTGGNGLLLHCADTFQRLLGDKGLFVRTNADTFNILAKYNDTKELEKLTNEAFLAISDYFDGYIISISFGIYLIEDKSVEMSVLSDRATIAMETAKSKPNVMLEFFSDDMRQKLLREKEIENIMQIALEEKQYQVYLQPCYSVIDEKIVGAEALVRWIRPNGNIMYPDEFIPIFEKSGFIKQLDYYMFEEVCKLIVKWREQFAGECVLISVNLSRYNMSNENLAQELCTIASYYGVKPYQIELEITETVEFMNEDLMQHQMNSLKEAGFIIAIDDFGAGYSSLNTLKNLPADILKLDRGFFGQAGDDIRSKEIIKNLISMARSIGLCTIAEGVEAKEQVLFLRDAGCDVAQGYYYQHPLPIEKFEKIFFGEKTKIDQNENLA